MTEPIDLVELVLSEDRVHGILLTYLPDRPDPVAENVIMRDGVMILGSKVYRCKERFDLKIKSQGTRRSFFQDGELFAEILLDGRYAFVTRMGFA